MMVQDKRLVTIGAAADEFGVTYRQVEYWQAHRKIARYVQPLTRRVLVDANEIKAKLEEIREEPAEE